MDANEIPVYWEGSLESAVDVFGKDLSGKDVDILTSSKDVDILATDTLSRRGMVGPINLV